MKTKYSRFTVEPYKNSWCVYGRRHHVDGRVEVIRENFKQHEKATARKHELEIAEINDQAGIEAKIEPERRLVPIPTWLSTMDVRQAESAKLRLKDHSLDFVVDYFLRSWKPSAIQRTVELAVQEFIAAKTAQKLRPDTIRDLRNRCAALAAAHGPVMVNEITTANVAALLNKPAWCAKQIDNQRKSFVNFFNWAVTQKYCQENPASAVAAPVVERGEVAVLSLADVRKLMVAGLAYEDGALMPHLVLSLFCGLRPAEVSRLQWSDVDLAAGTITIRAAATKVRQRRIVQPEPNVISWLLPHANRTRIHPDRFQTRWTELRESAGFNVSAWVPDVMRHTSLSHHVVVHGEAQTSSWAGTSVAMLHRHYRALVKATPRPFGR